jgi:hypothetical protein
VGPLSFDFFFIYLLPGVSAEDFHERVAYFFIFVISIFLNLLFTSFLGFFVEDFHGCVPYHEHPHLSLRDARHERLYRGV